MISEAAPQNTQASVEVIECTNPATGDSLGTVVVDTSADVQQAVERARAAQKVWAKSSFKKRKAVLSHISEYLLDHTDEICSQIVADAGKTFENALLGEIMPTCNKIAWLIKHSEKHLKPENVGSGILMHKKGRIDYVPLGVVACIIPWNYPLQNIISSLVAPLMAGNSVILKPSEQVAFSSQQFLKVIHQALAKEGISLDTVQIVQGFGPTGAALIDARVDKILFIGSVENGRRIIEASAKHITPVVMELGGKDPMIVCEDAHLEKAVHSAIGGCFINLGQNCVASERIIVHKNQYEDFCREVSSIANSMRQQVPSGPGVTDVGSLTSPHQIAIVEQLVNDAIAKGANVLAGGKRRTDLGQNFFPPTILTDLTDDMDIVSTEVFGPVMLIFKADSEADAIRMANDSNLGLQSSVITHDRQRGETIAKQIESGAVCINDFGLCYVNQDLPFGGTKYSGYGVMNGREGLRAYTTPKAILADRFPLEIPPKLFPVKPLDYEKSKASLQLLFKRSMKDKIKALLKVIGISIKAIFK